MKAIYRFIRSPIRMTRISKTRSRTRFRRSMLTLKGALAQEKQETKDMLSTYKRYTQGQATKEEMKQANLQLVDLIKGLGMGVVAILPFAPITIPVVLKLGKMVGVDVLPSSFYVKDDNKH